MDKAWMYRTRPRPVELLISLLTYFLSISNNTPELDKSEQVEKFVDIISGCIDTGFTEVRVILEGLGVLEDDIAENIDRFRKTCKLLKLNSNLS